MDGPEPTKALARKLRREMSLPAVILWQAIRGGRWDEAGSFAATNLVTLEEDDPYWWALRDDYGAGLTALVDRVPAPPNHR